MNMESSDREFGETVSTILQHDRACIGPWARIRSSLAFTGLFTATAFVTEFVLMLLLLDDRGEALWLSLLDAALLALILGPFFYLLVLRPLSMHIHGRRRAEQALARLGRILDSSANEIYLVDLASLRYLSASAGARRNLGFDLHELKQLTPPDLMPELGREQFLATIDPLRRHETEEERFETLQRRKDGSTYPVEVRVQISSTERPPLLVAIVQDISERRYYLSALEHHVLYDPLTELPNRSLLQDRFLQALKTVRRDAAPLAVLVVDVMRLREVNDILGHRCGDLVLQEVARRLQKDLRGSDTVARLAGDEFAIILPGVGADHVSGVTGTLVKNIEQAIIIDDTPLEIEIAIGVALYPDHGDEASVLLQRADIAMRVAKTERLCYLIYDPHDDPFSAWHLKLFGELRQAIHDRALVLYYQPKVDIASGKVTGVEALARWPHPVEGLIAPADFIPLVEQSGVIRPFTLWVLEEAVIQCARWRDAGLHLTLAVNLSTRNLLDPGLADHIAQLLDRYRVSAAQLVLEITESAAMSRSETAVKTIHRLHAIGLGLSIDDFGTGYSSLSYLKRLPVSELKIDQSFVSGMLKNEHDAVIVRSTIELAHNLGLKVVAEGVENTQTLGMLAELGCDVAQGYHYSRPLTAPALQNWLAARSGGDDQSLFFTTSPKINL